MIDLDKMYHVIRNQVRDHMEWEDDVDDYDLKHRIEEVMFNTVYTEQLTSKQLESLSARVFHSFRGLDALQPLIDDPNISEIMINSHQEIFIERNGRMQRSELEFESSDKLDDVIQGIVSKVNRVVNESSPVVDARLKDGSRVHVVLPPIALKGPTVTIRKFPAKPMTMEELIERGAISQEAAAFLSLLVQAKYNIFISGGTGSGKTTFLNALAQYIPEDERIITIEDAAELQIVSIPNLVSLETRNANTEGRGAITMRDLIRASLRMRPNRIVIGEVRGAEALDMLQALNTGHDGSLSTGHSNSTNDMMSRLETMVLSGAMLPLPVIRQQIASALDVIVHLARLRDGTRRVMEIAEVIGVKSGEIQLSPLYSFEEVPTADSRRVGELQPQGRLCNRWKLEMAGLSVEE